MSLAFSQKIQKVQEAVNIVDVVGQYLKLSHKGNNFWAVCPFHADSNPSLSVSKDKQIYKCFACGEQGDVFAFLKKYKNIDFISALKEVAKFAKLDLKDFELEINDAKKTELHRFKVLNNLALSFYQYQLITEEGQAAAAYLKQRHISQNDINQFGLGYAPSNNQLLEYLKMQGYQQIDILEAGLAKVTAEDKIKDMFFNRITFPITDLEGNCLGFSARKYRQTAKDNFKYVNTPETEIFKKGQILYNLYNAKNAVSVNTNSIYLVEGYMDVISLAKQGINNCVAVMGTNLTKEQMQILKKLTNNMIIFLDGDNPGKTAAYKIATNLLLNDFNVKVVDNPTNLDPDELIQQKSEEFKQIIANPIHPLAFAINFFLAKYDIKKDSDQLNQFLEQLKPMWHAIKDPVTIKFYLGSLHKITNLSEQELTSVFHIIKQPEIKTTSFVAKSKKKDIAPSWQEKLLEVQKYLFFLVLLDRSVYSFLEHEKFIFTDPNLMNLYFLISQQYQENEQLTKIDFDGILVLLQDNEISTFLEAIIKKNQNKNYDFKKSTLEDTLKHIKKYSIEIEIEKLNHQIINSDNYETKIELLKQMASLKK